MTNWRLWRLTYRYRCITEHCNSLENLPMFGEIIESINWRWVFERVSASIVLVGHQKALHADNLWLLANEMHGFFLFFCFPLRIEKATFSS